MSTQKQVEYPNIPSILALVGGALIILVDLLLLAISVTILPHLNYTNTNFHTPQGYTGNPGALAAGFVAAIGVFGLVCGIVVTMSSVLLRLKPAQRQTWGVLILVFSILGFFGFGGFIVGSILGIVGGILALQWKPGPATDPTPRQ